MITERASFASDPAESRGRLHVQPPSPTRTPFQRDRDRIIHSQAFRRLMHKTQVFISPRRDHLRTRLTHSLEVAQIARSIARTLGANEDLTEALALSHDLGHPPFGHTGEQALHSVMQGFGGFDHNDQALRVLVKLERSYPQFEGLNLTWETLEGVVKHNGPVLDGRDDDGTTLPTTLAWFNSQMDLELWAQPGIEAQIAGIADDIAYNHHDMDDGLRAQLFDIDAVSAVPHVGTAFESVRRDFPGLDWPLVVSETVRRLIGDMVADVLAETRRRLEEEGVETASDIRRARRAMVAFGETMRENERALKEFLYANMYRNPAVEDQRRRGAVVVTTLFERFLADPTLLPTAWQRSLSGADRASTARVTADYIAGMTDRYARDEHERVLRA